MGKAQLETSVQKMTTVTDSTVVTLSVSSRMFGLVMWSLHSCTNWHFVVCDRYSPQHDIPEPFEPQLHIYYKGAIEWKVEKKQASRKTKQPLSIDVEGLRPCLSTICQCGSNSGIMISLMIWDHLGLLCPVVLVGILRSIRGGARKTFPQFIIWEHRNKRQLEKKQRKRSRWLLCQTKTKLQLLIEIQL